MPSSRKSDTPGSRVEKETLGMWVLHTIIVTHTPNLLLGERIYSSFLSHFSKVFYYIFIKSEKNFKDVQCPTKC